jgi:hypothetical protein
MMRWTRSIFWRSRGIAVTVMMLSACAGYSPEKKSAEVVPVEAAPKLTLEIDVETLEVRIAQPQGARTCSLCTPQLQSRYGRACEKAPQAGIPVCAGLVDSTVQDLEFITLARSSKNPHCMTVGSTNVGGTDVVTQLCICLPTDPPGACPAPAWYQ